MKRINRSFIVAFMVMIIFMCLSLTGVSADTYIVENGFKYTRDSDGYVTVHGYEGTQANVVVPSSFVGQTVARVAEYAFMYNTSVTSVSMPTTITTVDRGAFYGCTSLESVTLPKNCTQIGQYMFYDCSSLKSVTMPSVLKEVPRYCFSFCTSLESVTLPSTTKTIDDYAFSNCTNLKSVYVSKYTSYISPTAFENSPNVVIYGYMNTYAYEYAVENNIPFAPVDAADVYYVTFYNYDGTIFQKIPVTKGSTINFPSAVPVKPETDTHYYEFSYWSGNVSNVQQNEFLYPVFTEHEKEVEEELPKEYAVVFLDGDGMFIKMDIVQEGRSAYEPAGIPQKSDTPAKYFIFTGWDKDFTNVTDNMIVRAVFEECFKEYIVTFLDADDNYYDEQTVFYGERVSSPTPPQRNGYVFIGWDTDLNYVTSDLTVRPVYEEEPSEYIVTFLDFNGEYYDEYIVMYGETVNPPTPPEVEGYTFVGWDQDTSFITGDMVVTPVYEKIKAPVVLPTTGTLKVEVSGGTGFTITVDGKDRPQGATYMNTKMPIGATVTVTAKATDGAEFIGWVSPDNGKILSKDLTYTFTSTGNNFVKATFATKVEGVQFVKFVNDKSQQILEMQYYASTETIEFPNAPLQVGYDFTGWDMTEEEIKSAIAAGQDVTVTAEWTRQIVYVNVTVIGGTGGGQVLANNACTVTANAPEEGMKFAYWVDGNGNIKSYQTSYKLFPASDMTLEAVFVAEDAVVEQQVLVSLDTIDTTSVATANNFYYSWSLPEDCTVVQGGIIAVNKANYKESTFYANSTDSNVYTRPTTSKKDLVYAGSWTKSNVAAGDTWIAQAFIIYKDANGETHTVYSQIVEATKE